jgi:hypothetical protein
MSHSSIQRAIESIQAEIERLHRQQTDEARKEASKAERISQIRGSITRTTSESIARSRLRDIDSLERDIVASQKRRADIMKRITDRTTALHQEQQRLYKEQDRERRGLMDSLQRSEREREARDAALLQQLGSRIAQSNAPAEIGPEGPHDAFISHASEDKETVARPLAEKLRERGFTIWYDEFQLKVGDSLRRSIDRGLASSRFGIVVLSPAFFAKNWPQYELDGLVAKEIAGGKVILPLWHKLSKDEVMSFSPTLADRVALNTATHSIDELVDRLAEVLEG